MDKDIRAVLEHVLAEEQDSYEYMILEHGEDSPLLENHIWQKAMNVFLNLGLDK